MLVIVAVVSSVLVILVLEVEVEVTSSRFCWLTDLAAFFATLPIAWLTSLSE